MLPRIPRRRSRRRSVSGRVVLLLCALAVTALLVGGVTQESRQSGRFDANQNRAFATLGSVVAVQSNATAADLRHLMATLQTQDRPALQVGLDGLVQQAQDEASRAAEIADPHSPAGVQADFAQVYSERAEAVSAVRSSIDGLLGMQPLPVAGAPGGDRSGAAAPALLSSTEASNRIAAAGALLIRADGEYRALRGSLERAVGHARLPASKWVTDAQVWEIGAVATQVDLVTASSTLAATHRLVLSTVRISPQALPSPNGSVTPGVSVLSPTTTVTVTVVLSNDGSVGEPHASVQYSMTALGTGVAVTKSRSDALASGWSVTLSPVVFNVKPGHSYQLRVAIVLPAAQSDVTETSQTVNLQIAPST
jgi:hypothetical protein